jgi:glycosyltransferase involved in cell wall biosynthesis
MTVEKKLSEMKSPSDVDVEPALELSVVMPCLNEADTIGTCIEKALRALRENDIRGEVIIADNGSTDDSSAIATRLGARVVAVKEKGYGSALMGGIAAARGKFIIMGDADDSYDFLEIPSFVKSLRDGYDLVQGCRLPVGGGEIAPGAMPFLHRWWGNPMFSRMAQWWFATPVHDIYCGMRGFTKELYERLDQRCTGMEFATEMIIKSSMYREKIGEVPITLHPDGRKAHAPHLRTFRDGWRTLRFFLMYSPKWLFFMPGLLLILLGLVGYAVALPGLTVMGVTFDAHTLLFATLAILCGYQSVLFALFSKTFAISEGLMPEDPRLERLYDVVELERGLLAGGALLLGGLSLLAASVYQWRAVNFGHLDYAHTMRLVIPGAALTAIGFQTILSIFFLSILRMRRR